MSITTSTEIPMITSHAPRRADGSLAGQLNTEWAHLCDDPATAAEVGSWSLAQPALAGCRTLTEVEQAVGVRRDPARTDALLLALLTLAQGGHPLAGRAVLQLMLGKAIRIAQAHTGRDSRAQLENITITTLYTVIATYPIHRRPTKVAANIAMDTLHGLTVELAHHRAETPTDPTSLPTPVQPERQPADLELLNLLAWAVDRGTVSPKDATLVMDIYAPSPGQPGGAAAAERHGLSWPAARQRASRAVRRIVAALQADG